MYPLHPFVSIMLHLSAFHAIDECTFIYFLKFKYHKSNVTSRPDEGHSICNCSGTYVHQVPL